MNGMRTNGSRITPLAVASGAIASFDAQVAAPLKILKADIDPVQAGSGDPAPDNIRPVSGWNSVKVSATGKNMLNETDKITLVNNVRYGFTNGIVLPAGTYTISGEESYQGIYVDDFNTSTHLFAKYNSNFLSFTLSQTTVVKFDFYKTDINQSSNFQCELGSSATTYEPYNGQTATIALPHTVYGGKLDALSGAGIENKGKVIFNGNEAENWINYDAENGFYISIPNMKSGTFLDGISNWLQTITATVNFGIRFGRSNRQVYCCHITDNIPEVTDLATWKTYLASHNLEVIFPLATPTEIITDPISMNSRAGSNNIFTDSGNTTACYLKGVTT